jgi:hypothetical protein
VALAVVGACSPSPSTSPGPSSASATPSASSVSAGDWTLVELPDAVGVWFASGVIADADGFVVFGGVNDRPAAWTSADGDSWASAALPGGFGFPSDGASSLTATVLLGAGSTSLCAHPFGESLWRRGRGAQSWQAVPFVEPLFCAGGFAELAATDDAFAVVGMGTGDQPFAWQSDDGMTWRDAAAGIPFDVPPSLLAATDGGFLELGRGERTDVRASVDGRTWSAVEAPPVPPAFSGDAPGMSPAMLLATSLGVIAIYESDGASGRSAWLRNADASWSEVALQGFEPGDVISGGVEIGGRPFLFGSRQGAASLMTSTDLGTWVPVPIPEGGGVLGLASFGDRTMLVTYTPDPAGGPDVTRVYETSGSLIRR